MRSTNTHIYFWRGIFSNWYPCQFTIDNILFYNTEQAFMYRKAILFDDKETAEKIIAEKDPHLVKKFGREIKDYNDDVWSLARRDAMFKVNLEKFKQNPGLAIQLLDTGDKVLVEASPYDKVWGVGLAEDDDRILDESNWQGTNLLGNVLENVRKHIATPH